MVTQATLRKRLAGGRRHRPTGPANSGLGDLMAPLTEGVLDRFTHLIGVLLDVPVACVSLMDADLELLTSSYGLPGPTALLVSHPFWKQVVATGRLLVIEDGSKDPLVAHNPAVRDGTVMAYVGIPLVSTDGRAVGTLFVMDRKPRQWSPTQLALLRDLAAVIVRNLERSAASRRTMGHRLALLGETAPRYAPAS